MGEFEARSSTFPFEKVIETRARVILYGGSPTNRAFLVGLLDMVLQLERPDLVEMCEALQLIQPNGLFHHIEFAS